MLSLSLFHSLSFLLHNLCPTCPGGSAEALQQLEMLNLTACFKILCQCLYIIFILVLDVYLLYSNVIC